MLLEYEALLMGSVVSLYLYDSTFLLYANEGVLIPGRKQRWHVGFGSDRARILGRELFIPNPFLPHRPMFRLSWQFEGRDSVLGGGWTTRRDAFGPLVPLVWVMAVALFVLLPAGLFTRLGERMILSAILLLYLGIVLALIWLWVNRARLELSSRRLAGLSFESLACSPFALNLIRKISMGIPVREDLVSAARRLQGPDDWRSTRMEMIARLNEELEGEEDDSERALALMEHRRNLSERDAACPARKSS